MSTAKWCLKEAGGKIWEPNRNGAPTVRKQPGMDALTYDYQANTNRLRHVGDNAGYTGNYTEDIDNQSDPDNYTYGAKGNLKTDAAESITAINRTVYGKIASITKNGNPITYSYDATGNRITKTANGITTVYVRDATGLIR